MTDDSSRRPHGLDALFIVSSLAVGGTESKVVRLAGQLRSRGRRVAIAYLGAPDTLLATIPAGIRVLNLERRGKFSPRAVMQLTRLLAEERPATVFVAQLYCLLYAQSAIMLAPGTTRRTIAMINTSAFVRKRDRLFMLIYAPILRHMSALVFGCQRQMEDWLRRYRLPQARASVIYNGVDVDAFVAFKAAKTVGEARAAVGVPASCIVVGTVGRLAPEKNQIALVDLLRRLVDSGIDAYVLMVGEGPCRTLIERRAQEIGVQNRLRLTGVVQDVRGALLCMDVFILPSSSETMSNAALEAMAIGCPLVLADVGGASEIVRQGIDGFVYTKDGVEELFDQTRVLCVDESLRKRMGAAALTRARQNFSIGRMVDQYDIRIGTAHPVAPGN